MTCTASACRCTRYLTNISYAGTVNNNGRGQLFSVQMYKFEEIGLYTKPTEWKKCFSQQ